MLLTEPPFVLPTSEQQSLLDAMDGPAAILDRTGTVLLCNRNWAFAVGTAPVPTEDRPALEAAIARVLGGACPMRVSVKRDVREVRIARLDAGRVLATLHGGREEAWRTALEAMPAGVIVRGADGMAIAWNPAALRILGITDAHLQGNVIGAPPWRPIREDGSDIPGNELPAAITLRDGTAFRNVIVGVRRDGADTRWLSVSTSPVWGSANSPPTGVISVFEDVTEKHRVTELLRESEDRYRSLFEHGMDGVILSAPSGSVYAVNPAAAAILRRSPADIIAGGRPVVADPEDPRLGPAIEERDTTGRFRGELTFLRGDGTRFQAEVATGLFVDRHGQTRTTVMFRDITARKELETLRERLVSIVSHEIRTPMASVHGALRLLEGGVYGELPAGAGELVHIAITNTERLTRLLNDLLDLDRMNADRMQLHRVPVWPAEVLRAARDAVHHLARERGAVVVLAEVPDQPFHADVDRVVQVLVNLLSNAIRYSPPGERVEMAVVPLAEALRFTVRDRGPGINPRTVDQLFQPFSQLDPSRDRGGSGLGLAISKAIVELHGGRIGVESSPGEGATFWFEIGCRP